MFCGKSFQNEFPRVQEWVIPINHLPLRKFREIYCCALRDGSNTWFFHKFKFNEMTFK